MHAIDPTDDDWHLDGTPHIDHNHLIVAIAGVYADGSLPQPGATKAFDLHLNAVPQQVLDSNQLAAADSKELAAAETNVKTATDSSIEMSTSDSADANTNTKTNLRSKR